MADRLTSSSRRPAASHDRARRHRRIPSPFRASLIRYLSLGRARLDDPWVHGQLRALFLGRNAPGPPPPQRSRRRPTLAPHLGWAPARNRPGMLALLLRMAPFVLSGA